MQELRQQEQPLRQQGAPVPIPFPIIQDIDQHIAPSPAQSSVASAAAASPAPPMMPMSPGSVEEAALFRNRDDINRQQSLRHILDTYCATDKSRADIRAFNRDYLQSISDICNNAL